MTSFKKFSISKGILTNAPVFFVAVLTGLLYILPPLIIAEHRAAAGEPFVLTSEAHRTDLHYLTRGREVYDGHFPPGDPSLDSSPPSVLNFLPPLVIAGFLTLSGGDVNTAYLAMVFVFPAIAVLLFYVLGRQFGWSRSWSLFLAIAGVLTPMALRIFNFDSGA